MVTTTSPDLISPLTLTFSKSRQGLVETMGGEGVVVEGNGYKINGHVIIFKTCDWSLTTKKHSHANLLRRVVESQLTYKLSNTNGCTAEPECN